jgi:hypothetical protein
MGWNGLAMVGQAWSTDPGWQDARLAPGVSPTAGRGRSGGEQHEKELPATRFDLRGHRELRSET